VTYGTGAAQDDRRRPSEETLRTVFQEVCKSHGAIADFRARLLALLPIATGSGVFILLGTLNNEKVLAPIGMFGFVTTLGLFLYELRGIEDCTMLRIRAAELEHDLGIAKERSVFDSGNWRRGRVWGAVDEIGAAWIIYPAVLASWAYLAGVGLQSAWSPWPSWLWPWGLAVLYVAVVGLALGLGGDFWLYRGTWRGKKKTLD
jgi:hypothetical protein